MPIVESVGAAGRPAGGSGSTVDGAVGDPEHDAAAGGLTEESSESQAVSRATAEFERTLTVSLTMNVLYMYYLDHKLLVLFIRMAQVTRVGTHCSPGRGCNQSSTHSFLFPVNVFSKPPRSLDSAILSASSSLDACSR